MVKLPKTVSAARTLRNEFYNLPYIVYLKKYLIPPPPRPVVSTFYLWSHRKTSEIRETLKETPRHIILRQLVQHYKNNQKTDP
jgi:hypothetical protein